MITISNSAKLQIKSMMETLEDPIPLRFGVQGGGCSGLSYSLSFDRPKNAEDVLFEINGLQVVLSILDEPILKGTVVDYKQNLLGGGFTIDNPNAIASCGCGSSFRTKTHEGTPGDC